MPSSPSASLRLWTILVSLPLMTDDLGGTPLPFVRTHLQRREQLAGT
jgi:hypothetical protein